MSATVNNLGPSELLRNSNFFGKLWSFFGTLETLENREVSWKQFLAEMRKPDAANSGDLSKDKMSLKAYPSPTMLSLYNGRWMSGWFYLLPAATKKETLDTTRCHFLLFLTIQLSGGSWTTTESDSSSLQPSHHLPPQPNGSHSQGLHPELCPLYPWP